MQFGGMLPSFAGGGLFIGHGGEFVMQKTAVDALGGGVMDRINKTGKLPSGGSNVSVNIQGDIIPRQPNMTKDDVVKIVVSDFDNLGPAFQTFRRRSS